MKKRNYVVVCLALLAALIVVASPMMAQDQITLTDGINGSIFKGSGVTTITMVVPSGYCNGGTCNIASGIATGTGIFDGTGTYVVSYQPTTPDQGGFVGPFSLHVQADGSSMVEQTLPINFSYTSNTGTLTGTMTFETISATGPGLKSTAEVILNITGGTFATSFPNGANMTITWGLTFPLQKLWQVHGFATAEFVNGSIVPAAACQTLSLLTQHNGLPRVYAATPSDLIANFTQSNIPQQISCSAASPCGTIDVTEGSDNFTGDLVVTVQLGNNATAFQFDRMGFNSNVQNGFTLECFNFDTSCTAGVGGATLTGTKNEDGFGRFDHTLNTGLNGGSGCSSDGTGCKNVFTAVIGNSNGPLTTADFNSYVAGHIGNGTCTGYIATPRNQ